MWIKPQGYAEIITPIEDVVNLDHIRKERIAIGTNRMDSCTCGHCNSIFHISARMRPEDIGGLCKSCMRAICPRCLDKPCVPWEKQLEKIEQNLERQRTLRSYGI